MDVALHRPPPPPEIDAGFRETVLLDGCVVEPTVFSPGREQFTLELDWRARARVSLPLTDDCRARDGLGGLGTPQKLAYGQRVEIEARVRSPHNYNNPGGFDYTAYLARQDIFWTATMTQGIEGGGSSGTLRLAIPGAGLPAANRGARKNRPALPWRHGFSSL